ncbi:MAG: hypothetical protein O2807_08045, partial [bacterium]|nr:hypothetical protein [bacterium]
MRWRSGKRGASGTGDTAKKPQSMRLTGQLLRALGAESGDPKERPWDFEVLIARPGPSRDGSWFLPAAVLRAAAPLFEGAQAFANHAEGKGPDIKNLVGWHRQVRMTEEGLLSAFAVSKSAAWFHAMANDALERGIAEPFGFSFDVMAEAEIAEGEAGRVLHFRKIVAVNSVDVVHKGRLGGALLGRAAAGVSDVEDKMLDKVFEKLRAAAPGAAEKLGAGWTPGELLAACEEAGLEWSLDGREKMKEGAARARVLAARLAASALPEPVQEKVRDQFQGADFSEAEV